MTDIPRDLAVDYGTERMPSTVELLTAQVADLKAEVERLKAENIVLRLGDSEKTLKAEAQRDEWQRERDVAVVQKDALKVAASLPRNTNACNIYEEDGDWIAVPKDDFQALRAALKECEK